MTPEQIYQKYQIPPNLIDHMQWVAEVVGNVLSNWRGPAVDKELTLLAAKLHDLGNIVKFRRPFKDKIAKKLMDNLDHWYTVQDQYIFKYGTNANQATHKILAELGLSASVGRVLREMELVADRYLDSADGGAPDPHIGLEARILEYADCCVSPEGIVGFEARLRDLCDRYNHRSDEPWTLALRHNAFLVESYLSLPI